jgi:hypothetical protein
VWHNHRALVGADAAPLLLRHIHSWRWLHCVRRRWPACGALRGEGERLGPHQRLLTPNAGIAVCYSGAGIGAADQRIYSHTAIFALSDYRCRASRVPAEFLGQGA